MLQVVGPSRILVRLSWEGWQSGLEEFRSDQNLIHFFELHVPTIIIRLL